MNENLKLIKSSKFGDVECDIYSNEKEMFMTMNQLSNCLGYKEKDGIKKIVKRNEYLKQKEFSQLIPISFGEGGTKWHHPRN